MAVAATRARFADPAERRTGALRHAQAMFLAALSAAAAGGPGRSLNGTYVLPAPGCHCRPIRHQPRVRPPRNQVRIPICERRGIRCTESGGKTP